MECSILILNGVQFPFLLKSSLIIFQCIKLPLSVGLGVDCLISKLLKVPVESKLDSDWLISKLLKIPWYVKLDSDWMISKTLKVSELYSDWFFHISATSNSRKLSLIFFTIKTIGQKTAVYMSYLSLLGILSSLLESFWKFRYRVTCFMCGRVYTR